MRLVWLCFRWKVARKGRGSAVAVDTSLRYCEGPGGVADDPCVVALDRLRVEDELPAEGLGDPCSLGLEVPFVAVENWVVVAGHERIAGCDAI